MTCDSPITATGSLDVLRYGHVLRSRMMVGLRGASMAYDGLYYAASVTALGRIHLSRSSFRSGRAPDDDDAGRADVMLASSS